MKRIVIIFILSFLLLLVATLVLSFFGKKPTFQAPPTFPTPTPVFSPNTPHTGGITLENAVPADKSTNILTNQNIVLTFNRTLLASDISFAIAPTVPFTASVSGNLYIVKPQEPLLMNTTYMYFVTIKGFPSYTYTFSTINDPSITSTPDYANEVETAINQHNYPDMYLSRYTPYDTNDFTVTSDYNDTAGAFYFTVTYYVPLEQAQKEFADWVVSTGLTKEQVTLLHVTYQKATPAF